MKVSPSLSIHEQTLKGFHIPSSTDKTVAIRSQFLLSKPLKFTPRRSLLPIMSPVLLFPPKKGETTMAPVETQKTPAVGMSDADDAEEEDGEAALLQQRMQPSDAADGQRWCEGGSVCVSVCVCVCVCWREREREWEGRREGDGLLLPPPPFPHTRCLWHFLLFMTDTSLCCRRRN